MTTRPYNYLCIHGHFYQPPRGNPISGEIGEEPSAAPFHDWNERVTAEFYGPNAAVGNFERISFDVGENLMRWLKANGTETYERIIQSDRGYGEQQRTGNAVARPYYHVILPLSRLRDKRTLLYWGRKAFANHFGHEPEGLWLPEMAFDLETLQAVRAAGFTYTILAQNQVEGGVEGGPYLVDLQNGDLLAVFVRNDDLSNDLSFNIGSVGGAGHWARSMLGSRSNRTGRLTLIATVGETFGHHHLGEEQFLRWLLEREASAVGYKVVTLTEYLRDNPPTEYVEVKPFSSWSCMHGVARWVTGCECTPGNSTWKGALRRALDNLSGDMHELYMDVVRPHGVNPWALRDGYIQVMIGELSGSQYLAKKIPGLTTEQETRLLLLLQAQVNLLRCYNSFTFFFEDLDRPEPRYAIGGAAYAIYLVQQATGVDLGRRFRNELYLAYSERSRVNGGQIYDLVVDELLTPKSPYEEQVNSESQVAQP